MPVLLLVRAPLPPRIALRVPFSTAYELPVSTPVLLEMVPPCRVTAPTVSLFAPSASVPLETVTEAESASTSLPPVLRVPPETTMVAEASVAPAWIFSVPAWTVVVPV